MRRETRNSNGGSCRQSQRLVTAPRERGRRRARVTASVVSNVLGVELGYVLSVCVCVSDCGVQHFICVTSPSTVI
jgi:hypothetical protein